MRTNNYYTPEEDQLVMKLVAENMTVIGISRVTGRTPSSVAVRIHRLREMDKMPLRRTFLGGRPRSDQPVSFAPAITLNDDDKLVNRCIAEGGFPTAVVLEGRTFWRDMAGNQWVHRSGAEARKALQKMGLSPAGAKLPTARTGAAHVPMAA